RAAAFAGLRRSSRDAILIAVRQSPSATSGSARSLCTALVIVCSAAASRPVPGGPVRHGCFFETSAYCCAQAESKDAITSTELATAKRCLCWSLKNQLIVYPARSHGCASVACVRAACAQKLT